MRFSYTVTEQSERKIAIELKFENRLSVSNDGRDRFEFDIIDNTFITKEVIFPDFENLDLDQFKKFTSEIRPMDKLEENKNQKMTQ